MEVKRVLCCREIQRSIRDSVKRLLDDKISALGLDRFYTSTDAEIRGQNGSLFIFAGLKSNPDKVKSTEGVDIAWVEEAHMVSQRSLDILTPTVRSEGSEIWCSWNPNQPTDPVDVMFRGKEPRPDSIVREVSYEDNPWFPEVLRTDMEYDRRTDPDKAAHIWDGAYWYRTNARVFNNWRVGSEAEFDIPEGTTFRFGSDWGFAEDPTVIVRTWLVSRKLYIDYEAYKIGCEIDHTPALFKSVPNVDQGWPIIADSARPETISYLRRHGLPSLKAAKKGKNSVIEGVRFLQSLEEIIIHPRCRHTIDEFRLYSYKIDPLTDAVLPVLEDKKNHCIDSVRYAYEGFRGSSWRPLSS